MVAITTTLTGYSQDTENQQLLEHLNLNMNYQIDLLETYYKQLGEEINSLKNQYRIKSSKNSKLKKQKNTPAHANFEVMVGITDNEGLGYHGNFNIEISNKKNSGLEMGLFYDNNDVLTKDAKLPSEVFLLNLGYTKQLNFLSNKTETISTMFAVGGVIGAEVLNNSENQLSTGAVLVTEDGLVYGGYIGIFSVFKISNKFSVAFRNTNFFTTSDVSLHKFIVGGGLRYSF